jgi:hypothetical protein
MRRNDTKTDKRNSGRDPIPSTQITALEALLSGRSITDAAQVAGVSRTTLHRWLKDDFEFRAELNLARHALRQTALARLDSLCELSIEVLRKALETTNDSRVALEVLKGCGVLGGDRTIEPTHPGLLEAEDWRETEGRLAVLNEQAQFFP